MTPTITTEEHREVVREAAEYLDLHWPTEEIGQPWWEVVDLRLLQMESICRCVCGQLGAKLAAHEGHRVNALGRVEVPGGRQLLHSGFGLLRTWRDNLNEIERELTDKLAKRLGVKSEGEYPLIPEYLAWAFAGRTPNRWWVEEIEARRA